MKQNSVILLCFVMLACAINVNSEIINSQNVQTPSKTSVSKIVVKGRVSDLNGEPVIGASVFESGNKINGTITDINGNYFITVTKSSVLIFSHIGYVEREVTIIEQNEVNVILQESRKVLDEVVVIGYGVQKKTDLTGAVGILDINSVVKAPIPDFTDAISGRVAGVQTISGDGQPGSLANIVIRGGNSITQSNAPLYVLDGVPLENINDVSLNMNDVESFTVLKDASSTAIYGSRGANGVIVITTKESKSSNKTSVRYNAYAGFNMVSKKLELMDPYDFIKYQLEINPTNATSFYLSDGKVLDDYKSVKGIDWQEQLFRQGFSQNHNVIISGGKQTRFNLSLSAIDQDGVVINSGYKKYQGRLNLNHDTKNVKFNLGISYTDDETYGEIASSPELNLFRSYYLYRTWSYRPIAGGVEDLLNDLIDPESATLSVNPIKDIKNSQNSIATQILMINSLVDIKLMEGLNFKIRGALTKRTRREESFYNSLTSRGSKELSGNTKGVNGGITQREFDNFTNENTLTYSKKKLNHSFVGLLGVTYNQNNSMYFGLTAEQIPYEQLSLSGMDYGTPGAISTYWGDNKMLSTLGRIDYGYKDKYLFTTTFRADASSKFDKKNRWGYFPSLAIGWRLIEEKFMKNLRFISNAKLRLSYGVTGNNRIGDYTRFAKMDSPRSSWYSFDNSTPIKGIDILSIESKGLRWEQTSQYDAGVDLSFFNNRINIVLDWYYKITNDLLLNSTLPYTSGFATVYKNIGNVSNRGHEITISTLNIQTKKFSWESNFNISFNQNRVESLAEGESKMLTSVYWTGAFKDTPMFIAEKGKSIGMFYGLLWDGVYNYDDFDLINNKYVLKSSVHTNGTSRDKIQPGDIKYVDVNNDGIISAKDNIVIGRGLPIHIGGFDNNFRYKNLTLNIFLQWSYGNDIMNANRIYLEGNIDNSMGMNQLASYSKRWTPDNPDATMYRVWGQGPKEFYSTRTLEDGSYLRLKTVSLSYDLPSRFLKHINVRNINVYISGQNLYTWTNYSGVDPEVSLQYSALTPGLDFSTYPRAKTFVVGLKVNF